MITKYDFDFILYIFHLLGEIIIIKYYTLYKISFSEFELIYL